MILLRAAEGTDGAERKGVIAVQKRAALCRCGGDEGLYQLASSEGMDLVGRWAGRAINGETTEIPDSYVDVQQLVFIGK